MPDGKPRHVKSKKKCINNRTISKQQDGELVGNLFQKRQSLVQCYRLTLGVLFRSDEINRERNCTSKAKVCSAATFGTLRKSDEAREKRALSKADRQQNGKHMKGQKRKAVTFGNMFKSGGAKQIRHRARLQEPLEFCPGETKPSDAGPNTGRKSKSKIKSKTQQHKRKPKRGEGGQKGTKSKWWSKWTGFGGDREPLRL